MNLPQEYTPPPPPVQVRVPLAKPIWAYVLLGFTVFVYILQLALGESFTYLVGLKVNELIRAGEYWRLITPVFFHATNPLHILFNMYALYMVGPELERPLGHARFLFIYLLAGFAGVLASFVFSPDYSLGASGAIFGMIGAFAVFLYRNQRFLGRVGQNTLYNVVFIIILNVILSFSGGIDLWAHFGGLLTGTVAAWLIGPVWGAEPDPDTGMPRIVDRNSFAKRWTIAIGILIFFLFLTLWLVR
jgi:rhomboid protease GluP